MGPVGAWSRDQGCWDPESGLLGEGIRAAGKREPAARNWDQRCWEQESGLMGAGIRQLGTSVRVAGSRF